VERPGPAQAVSLSLSFARIIFRCATGQELLSHKVGPTLFSKAIQALNKHMIRIVRAISAITIIPKSNTRIHPSYDCSRAAAPARTCRATRRRLPLEHQGQLPGQVDHVLDARVHALSAGRAVDVGRVPAEQQAANLQARHHPAVDAEPGAPTHVPEPRRDARALVVDRLQLLERRRRVLTGPAERVAGHQAEASIAHGEQAQETAASASSKIRTQRSLQE